MTELRLPRIGSAPRAAEEAAMILREAILDGTIVVGHPPPSERLLTEQLLISRSTLREALAILRSQGFITALPNQRDGSLVSLPGAASIRDLASLALTARRSEPSDALDLLLVLLPACAALAASRHDVTDAIRLDALAHAAPGAFGDWLAAVVTATHDVALCGVTQAAMDMDGARIKTREIAGQRLKIAAAILDRNGESAGSAMRTMLARP